MKIIYEAIDGTQFENEDDCKEYELTSTVSKNAEYLNVYDRGLKIIPTDDLLKRESEWFIVNVKDEDGLDFIEYVFKNGAGFSYIDNLRWTCSAKGVGVFVNMYNNEDWYSNEDFLTETERFKNIEQIIKQETNE